MLHPQSVNSRLDSCIEHLIDSANGNVCWLRGNSDNQSGDAIFLLDAIDQITTFGIGERHDILAQLMLVLIEFSRQLALEIKRLRLRAFAFAQLPEKSFVDGCK